MIGYSWQPNSVGIVIPTDEHLVFEGVKDICAGMGGITQGLEMSGFRRLASLDNRELMCETLKMNGHDGVILGDVLTPLDRACLHATPYPARCTLASGFPCQPLSSQGDKNGAQDSRSRPFFGVLKAAWEQHCAALVLENVKAAQDSPYIQQGLQCLAWSLGMHYVQKIISLEDIWPCRRTRWWLLMIPKKYDRKDIQAFPQDCNLQHINQLFMDWPHWPESEDGGGASDFAG